MEIGTIYQPGSVLLHCCQCSTFKNVNFMLLMYWCPQSGKKKNSFSLQMVYGLYRSVVQLLFVLKTKGPFIVIALQKKPFHGIVYHKYIPVHQKWVTPVIFSTHRRTQTATSSQAAACIYSYYSWAGEVRPRIKCWDFLECLSIGPGVIPTLLRCKNLHLKKKKN